MEMNLYLLYVGGYYEDNGDYFEYLFGVFSSKERAINAKEKLEEGTQNREQKWFEIQEAVLDIPLIEIIQR